MKQSLFMAVLVIACSMYSCKSNNQVAVKPEAADAGLTNKYWKLVELMGEPVTYPEGAANEAYISFKPDGKVNGSLGCNTFAGSYTEQLGTRIKFSQLVNTQKMCLDMTIETKLVQVLQTADSYNLTGNQLILNRARMAPLARFEVVYM
jgi:heat shock protein HslJ